VQEALRDRRGGDLLDVGCGPGMMVRQLLDMRPGDFRITASDLSPAMVEATRQRVGDTDDVQVRVASIEDLPFPDESYDVVLAMGVLEYVDVARALGELARVARPGGLVLVTMLNPASPYRLFEWVVYWPALRVLGRLERLVGARAGRRHGANRSGIRAVPVWRLRRRLRAAGLVPQDTVYYDVTPLVPPLDTVVRRWTTQRWRSRPERTVGRGARQRLGTAYLVAARRG
jgi:SAM-dependent methyltransferase